jgi:hypothetical protein
LVVPLTPCLTLHIQSCKLQRVELYDISYSNFDFQGIKNGGICVFIMNISCF